MKLTFDLIVEINENKNIPIEMRFPSFLSCNFEIFLCANFFYPIENRASVNPQQLQCILPSIYFIRYNKHFILIVRYLHINLCLCICGSITYIKWMYCHAMDKSENHLTTNIEINTPNDPGG